MMNSNNTHMLDFITWKQPEAESTINYNVSRIFTSNNEEFSK